MAPGTLAVVALVNLVTAASFFAVGARLLSRRVSGTDQLGMHGLVTWWICMACVVGIQGLLAMVVVAGRIDLNLFEVGRYANAFLLAGGVWGLCFHVAYLRSGRRLYAWLFAAYAVVVALLYIMSVINHPLVAITPTAYEAAPTYDPPEDSDPYWKLVVASVGLPLIIASISYLVLVPKLHSYAQKRRAALASAGILTWVATGLVTQFIGGTYARFVTYTVLGLVAALLVYVAYFFGPQEEPAID